MIVRLPPPMLFCFILSCVLDRPWLYSGGGGGGGQRLEPHRHGIAIAGGTVNGGRSHPHTVTTVGRAQTSLSRERRREEVLLRSQKILKERRRAMEDRQRNRERMASNLRCAAMRDKLAGVWERNRVTDWKTQQAKLLQAARQQAREKKLKDDIQHANEVLHRRENLMMFRRLRTAQRIAMSSQWAHANRSLIERGGESRRLLQEKREEARQRAVEDEKISKEIELQQRRLIHDERALRSIEYQRKEEFLRWERGVERQRKHTEQIWQCAMQKGYERSERMRRGARAGCYASSARVQNRSVISTVVQSCGTGSRYYILTMDSSFSL